MGARPGIRQPKVTPVRARPQSPVVPKAIRLTSSVRRPLKQLPMRTQGVGLGRNGQSVGSKVKTPKRPSGVR